MQRRPERHGERPADAKASETTRQSPRARWRGPAGGVGQAQLHLSPCLPGDVIVYAAMKEGREAGTGHAFAFASSLSSFISLFCLCMRVLYVWLFCLSLCLCGLSCVVWRGRHAFRLRRLTWHSVPACLGVRPSVLVTLTLTPLMPHPPPLLSPLNRNVRARVCVGGVEGIRFD